jgi:uncharacterized membrane protein YkoI
MLLSFIFSFATIGYTQKITEKDLPVAVKTAFNTKFPGAANVKWGKENAKEYEAEFKFNNNDVSANFLTTGEWVETETVLAAADIPATITSAIKMKYPGASITKGEKLEKPGDKILYEVFIKTNGKTKEVELNADGSFVK